MARYFDVKIDTRLTSEQVERIDRVVQLAKNTEGEPKYDGESHFYRCAINKLLMAEEQSIQKNKSFGAK